MSWRFLLHISCLCICIINSLSVHAGTTTLESGDVVTEDFMFFTEVTPDSAHPSGGLSIGLAGLATYGSEDIHIDVGHCLPSSKGGKLKITPYGNLAKIELMPPDNNHVVGYWSIHCTGRVSMPVNSQLMLIVDDGTGVGAINSNLITKYQVGKVNGSSGPGNIFIGRATDFGNAKGKGVHRLFYPESLLLKSGEENVETLLRYTCAQGNCTGMEVEIGTTGIRSQDIKITHSGKVVSNGYVRMLPGTELSVTNKSTKIGRSDGTITLNVSVY